MKLAFIMIAIIASGCGQQSFKGAPNLNSPQNKKPNGEINTPEDPNEKNDPSIQVDEESSGIVIDDATGEVIGESDEDPHKDNQGADEVSKKNQLREEELFVDRVCKPLDATGSRRIQAIYLRLYPINGGSSLTIKSDKQNRANIDGILNRGSLPKKLFGKVPDGDYTVLFCDAKYSSGCSLQNADQIRRINTNNMDLSTFSNEPLTLLTYFGPKIVSPDEPRVGGIPVLSVRQGVPIIPEKAREVDSGLLRTTVNELGVILDPNGDIISSDCTESPLVIDFGDGISLTSVNGGVDFDIDGDGRLEHTAWLGADGSAGFLAWDRNHNQLIDNGNELFGNHSVGPDEQKSANGFLALSKYDLNGDGVIDAKDSIFNELLVWRDMNHNGMSEPGEITTLRANGIASIDVNYFSMNMRDAFGNSLRQGSYVKTESGKQLSIYDVWFKKR